MPEEISAIEDRPVADDFVTTGFTKVNGRWYQCGASVGVTATDENENSLESTPELPINLVAAKLNELEDALAAKG